jgi:hypothetical protein
MGVKNTNPGVHLGYFRLRKHSSVSKKQWKSSKSIDRTHPEIRNTKYEIEARHRG